MAVLILLALAGLSWTGYKPWKERQNRLFASTKAEVEREPVVTVVMASRAPSTTDLVLPSAISAVLETPVYARAEGYITKLYVDIGDKVKEGQVLLDVDTPDLDEQLRQNRHRYNQFKASSGSTMAALVQSKASLKLAEVVLNRTKKLVAQGIMAQQDLDDKQAAYDVAFAATASAQAAVESAEEGKKAVNSDIERLIYQTQYKKVVAPFTGVITVRNCAVGNLVSGTAAANTGAGLYRIADPRVLRVFIAVPQTNAPSVQVGMGADLELAEFPGRLFHGTVARTASSIDPAARTLRTEVRIENKDWTILPGMYGNVHLKVPNPNTAWIVPGDTTLARPDGTYVAVVEPNMRIRLQKLNVSRDMGRELEVIQGLRGDERLVVNPSDDIREGVEVKLAGK
jgi:RND family efflux transporter MFP subunit